jgi:hypothetical protein
MYSYIKKQRNITIALNYDANKKRGWTVKIKATGAKL